MVGVAWSCTPSCPSLLQLRCMVADLMSRGVPIHWAHFQESGADATANTIIINWKNHHFSDHTRVSSRDTSCIELVICYGFCSTAHNQSFGLQWNCSEVECQLQWFLACGSYDLNIAGDSWLPLVLTERFLSHLPYFIIYIEFWIGLLSQPWPLANVRCK